MKSIAQSTLLGVQADYPSDEKARITLERRGRDLFTWEYRFIVTKKYRDNEVVAKGSQWFMSPYWTLHMGVLWTDWWYYAGGGTFRTKLDQRYVPAASVEWRNL